MKISIFFIILLYQIVNADTMYQFMNFTMCLSDHQPSENTIMFKTNYKKCTTFEIEKESINNLCYNNYEKNNAINCFKKYPNEWQCISENCIRPSRNQTKYYPINIIQFSELDNKKRI